jgi:hypothetical protein
MPKLWHISAKTSSIELFKITQAKDEFIRTYLKGFNEEMLKVEDLIKLVASEALISWVREKTLWRELYALQLDRRLLKMKQTMESHIEVEVASTLRHGPPRFIIDKQSERSPKRGRLLKRDYSLRRYNNPKRSQKKLFEKHLMLLH